MTARRLLALLLAAIAVMAAAWWLTSARRAAELTQSGAPVIQGLRGAVNRVEQISLSKGDGTRVTLERRSDSWRVVERDWPADSGKVRKLLLDLSELSAREEKTRLPANYAALGVEDVSGPQAAGTLVQIRAGTDSFGLIAGKPAGIKGRYVRLSGAAQSLLAEPQIDLETSPAHWLRRDLFDIAADRVQEVKVARAKEPAYTARRAAKEQKELTVAPLPKGAALSSPGAANPLTESLFGFAFDDVQAADAAGLAEHRASIQTFDGLVISVTGRKVGTRHLIAATASTSSSVPAVTDEAKRLAQRLAGREFEIPAYKYEALFRPLKELLSP